MIYKKREDSIISELSRLYKNYGYKRYKPSCFEEYSLYQENKDFLIGKNVITFSDLGGKLLAMRPDVTLSLIRHNDVESGIAEKFFYNEKVYRQVAGGSNYKEINQTGVEVVGKIDSAVECELTLLICKTLETVSESYILDVSHMGFTEGLLSEFPEDRLALSDCLKNKNLHDFYKLAECKGYPKNYILAFERAVNVKGSPENALDIAEVAAINGQMRKAVAELKELFNTLAAFGYSDKININFSAAANADYYNGVIFNGYLKGVPHCVLSGGRYDKLLEKFKKRGGAIGFALYLGEIERYLSKDANRVDFLIVYDENTQNAALKAAQQKIDGGNSVRISAGVPKGLQYSELIDLTDSGVKND